MQLLNLLVCFLSNSMKINASCIRCPPNFIFLNNFVENAALAILAAAIMTDEVVHIENLPDVRDINVLLEAIREIGATVERISPTEVKIVGATIGNITVEYEYIKKIRASYYLLGALLGKYKNAEVGRTSVFERF